MAKSKLEKSPRAPACLSKPAQALWAKIVSEWEIDNAADLAVLRTGLLAWDRAEAATAQIKRDGQTVTDRFGQVKPHPLMTTERDARSQFMNAIRQMGLA